MPITKLTDTSPGAPAAFNGSIGSLIALLDFCLVTTMGWTKTHSGTNLATYRAPTGNRRYLAVTDTATLQARLRVFDTATAAGVAVANGTNPVPTEAQVSGGAYFQKGADTTFNQPWTFLSDGKSFYLCANYYSSLGRFNILFFGDFVSYRPGDTCNTLLIAGNVSTSGVGNTFPVIAPVYGTTAAGHWLAGLSTQVAGSVMASKGTHPFINNSTVIGVGLAYPSPIEGGMLLSRLHIGEPGVGIRGHLPGALVPMHSISAGFNQGDTFSGSGELAGRNFEIWAPYSGGTASYVAIETTDNWGS